MTDAKTGRRLLLAYGDVMTIHTAQGSSSREHIFALPRGSQAVGRKRPRGIARARRE